MKSSDISHWQSPIIFILRRCAYASGAMQGGLEKLASNDTSLAPLNPLAWISIAVAVLAAAMRDPSDSNHQVPATGTAFPEDVSYRSVLPDEAALPARRPAFVLPVHRPGWGGNPFHPPAPAPDKMAAVASAQAAEPSVKASDLVRVINQDAMLWFLSLPDKTGNSAGIPWYDSPDTRSIIGFQLGAESLHRLGVMVAAPTNLSATFVSLHAGRGGRYLQLAMAAGARRFRDRARSGAATDRLPRCSPALRHAGWFIQKSATAKTDSAAKEWDKRSRRWCAAAKNCE